MLVFVSRSVLSDSTRKYLRREKARLRRQISDKQETEKKILELVAVIFAKQAKVKVRDGVA